MGVSTFIFHFYPVVVPIVGEEEYVCDAVRDVPIGNELLNQMATGSRALAKAPFVERNDVEIGFRAVVVPSCTGLKAGYLVSWSSRLTYCCHYLA